MFELISKNDVDQVNSQQPKSELQQLIHDAVLSITSISMHPDIGNESTVDLLCRYGASKISSLQLSPELRSLKKQYDDIEKKLSKFSATPENYQALLAAKSSAQKKLLTIKKRTKDISDNLKKGKSDIDNLRNKYTFAISQDNLALLDQIEADISTCIRNTEVGKIKNKSFKQSSDVIETEILLINEAMDNLVQKKIEMAYPAIKKEFDEALHIFLEVYQRTCTAAIAANGFEIYKQHPKTTHSFRKESKIHEKAFQSISAIRKSHDGEYNHQFKSMIIDELLAEKPMQAI